MLKITITVLALIISSAIFISFGFKNESPVKKNEIVNKDSLESVKAFMDVYKVLMSRF